VGADRRAGEHDRVLDVRTGSDRDARPSTTRPPDDRPLLDVDPPGDQRRATSRPSTLTPSASTPRASSSRRADLGLDVALEDVERRLEIPVGGADVEPVARRSNPVQASGDERRDTSRSIEMSSRRAPSRRGSSGRARIARVDQVAVISSGLAFRGTR